MMRPVVLAMLAFSASGHLLAAPGDVTLAKPTVACPQTQLGDERLQSQYDGLWKSYSEKVAAATKTAEDELTRLYESAKSAGNLDLALFWNGMKKSLAETGQLRWEPTSQKKDWKRFGDAEFPEGLTAVLSKCDAGFEKAKDALEEGYKTLEVALTKADKLEQALAIRKEFVALWGGAKTRTAEASELDSGKRSINLLEELDVESARSHDCWKMVGKCLQCTGEEVENFTSFTFRDPRIERLAEDGEYDLAFQMTIVPPREKVGSDVSLLLPGIPGAPTLWFRHYWNQKESKVIFKGSTRDEGAKKGPRIEVTSPVPFDRAKKIAVKVKVRRQGKAVTVLLNGRAVVDCNDLADLPTSKALTLVASLESRLTICDLTISAPEK